MTKLNPKTKFALFFMKRNNRSVLNNGKIKLSILILAILGSNFIGYAQDVLQFECNDDATFDCWPDEFNCQIPIDTPLVLNACGAVEIELIQESIGEFCEFIVINNWIAVDECGFTDTCVQVLSFNDVEAPIIECPNDMTVEVGFDGDYGDPIVSDNSGEFSLTLSEESTGEGCEEVIIRTWTAVDNCGNASFCSQQITVFDSTPPLLTCPIDAIYECDNDPGDGNYGTPVAYDASGIASLTASINEVGWAPCSLTKTIIWTAIDNCGNSTQCTQMVTIQDTTPPTITCPPDLLNVECDQTMPQMATATDNCCTNLEIVWTDVISGGPCNSSITRTWTAYDCCGNSSSCTQNITTVDTTPPTIICGADYYGECVSDQTYEGPIYFDNCQPTENILISFSDAISGSKCSPTGEMIARTWTADDGCGNISTCIQTITLFDTTPPTLYGCNDIVSGTTYTEGLNGGKNVDFNVFAGDLCDPNVSVSCTPSSGSFFPCNQATLVSCTATDACGLVTTCQFSVVISCFTLTFDDIYTEVTNEPYFFLIPEQVPYDVTSGCGELEAITIAYEGWPEDNLFECGNTEIFAIATDGCGDQIETSFQVIVEGEACLSSSNPPTIICPQDQIIECDADTDPNSSLGWAFATDDLTPTSDIVLTYNDAVDDTDPCHIQIVRTWIATDTDMNSSNCTQIIELIDTSPPVLNIPGNYQGNCGDTNFGQALAIDNCTDNVMVNFSDSYDNTDPCFTEITRTWTAQDDCGNVTSGAQLITLSDNSAPIISCPNDQIILGSPGIGAPYVYTITALDDCSSQVMVNDDWTIGQNFPCGTTVVTATAQDDCGNFSNCSFTVTVDCAVNVEETDQLSITHLYPNPTQDVINLEINSQSQNTQISIYDAKGILVLDNKISESICQLQVHQLLSGIYHIVIRDEHFNIVRGSFMKN